ncbi:hypothetical protein [Thermococcus sp. LS2]|uniref:hypothetical protein n=1 Tax=Thermococcus sp. LS2 TaxID=1638260 RepID=UPI00143A74AB|nr:hypothetical protein [Thermococcus sp. LS2]NJE13748.1 hypothetical protein [Thermococcus sp. LS2]
MGENIQYMVKLKYAKPAKLAVKREQKIAEFYPVVKVEAKKEFLRGKVEGRARVFLPEFLDFAKHLGFEVRGRKRLTLITSDDYNYLRLFVYAMGMQVLRDPVYWAKLEDHVLSMEPIPLRYWASTFKSAYWKYKTRRRVMKLARCFLEVEEVL